MHVEPDLKRDPSHHVDQRIFLHGLSWAQYEQLLDARGESSAVRISYLDGEVELMSPSRSHEWIKTTIARLLEAWAEEVDVELNGFGSWTLKQQATESGVEPDECYVVGSRETEVPDLAIEVVWTHGGIRKLDIYARLGVREVWIWKDGALEAWELTRDGYQKIAASVVLPKVDLAMIARFAEEENQTAAVRAFRAELRQRSGR